MTMANGNVLSRDLTSETVEVYSPAVTLHLAATSPPSFGFDCGKRSDGSYPDYRSGCRSFYVCKNGRASRFSCNAGEIYDPFLSHCISDRLGKCDDSGSRRREKQQSRCRTDGVYPDYQNGCRSFFACRNGIETRYDCSPDTKFDERRGKCRPDRTVPCAVLTCENKSDGVYEDVEGGCRRYYSCQGGVKREFFCPPGEMYDRRRSSCSSVVGGARCADLHFECAGLPDGYYPDYRDDCRTFYLCIGGHPKSFYCPPGMSFDRRLLSCDFSYRVACRLAEICGEGEDGIVADFDGECGGFAVCENGTSVRSGVCPQGKALDPETLTCQPRSMTSCRPVRDVQCGSKEDGIYADVDSGCGTYYLCIRGRVAVTSFCPEGTSFHASLGKCLSSAVVPCGSAPRPPVLPDICRGRIGLFPDFESDCRNYHVCAYGVRDTVRCRSGFMFDVRSRKCAPANSTACLPPTLLATFDCPVEEEERYPESGDGCTIYHECWRGSGTTYACPPGQRYDPSGRSCDFSGGACPRKVPGSARAAVSQVIQWQFNCSDKSNGVFVSDQCGMFHLCADGGTYSYICPPGRVFDAESLSCRAGTCSRSEAALWFADTGSFSCAAKKDGMYPDPSTYCRRYFICEKGKASVAYCREGEMFDERIVTCIDASSANCTSANSVARAKTPRKIPVRVQKSETPPGAFRCPAGKTGFFPDYQSGCRKFHICFRRLRKSYTCPSILLFNPVTKSCDLPENVKCRPEERVSANNSNCTFDPDCKRNYACADDDRPPSSDCPPGTVYNDAEGNCRNRAPCRKSVAPTETGRSSSTHAHGIPDRYVFTCSDKPDGFYPDYARDCHVFYRCVRGKKFSHYCKQGLLFDPSTDICQFEQTVDCSVPPSVEVT